jgi:FMN reductase
VSFVTVIGNPKPASRTLTVATAAADAITRAAGLAGSPQTIDLCVLARHLLLPVPSPAVEDALDQVSGADLLLVASPTYKGAYSGLLKVFADRLPHQALGQAVALPLMLMGVPDHAPAVDTYLRPLLIELGATVPVPGLAVLESDLGRLDDVLVPWADQVAVALAGSRLGPRPSPHPPPHAPSTAPPHSAFTAAQAV